MAKRDSKGRFLKKRGGKRRGGIGTIITMRRGMGALPGGPTGEAVIAPAVGGLVTALVTLAVRQMDPNSSPNMRMMVRWAWLVGGAAGAVSSMLLLLLGGRTAAISSGVATAAVSLGFYGQDMILQRNAGSIAAALAPDTATVSDGGVNGYRRGMRAIVPQFAGSRRGMGAMVLEPVGPGGHRAGTLGNPPYGTTVSLSGINASAFGTSSFKA